MPFNLGDGSDEENVAESALVIQVPINEIVDLKLLLLQLLQCAGSRISKKIWP